MINTITQRIRMALRRGGLRGLLGSVHRRLLRPQARAYAPLRHLFAHKTGLEIGGPSAVFRRREFFPVYPLAARIDNCNFSAETMWEGVIEEGSTFVFDPARPPGKQFIAEATALTPIPSESYDFVLSSHAIEHTANPLAALREWFRVLRPGGVLVLIVPHKDGTFDHRRPTTAVSHLVADDRARTDESDLTHLDEVLALHDLSRDPATTSIEAFRQRSLSNPANRGMHHHVFVTRSVAQMLDAAGARLLALEAALPFNILAIAERPDARDVDNSAFTDPSAEWYRRSPFPSDIARGTEAP